MLPAEELSSNPEVIVLVLARFCAVLCGIRGCCLGALFRTPAHPLSLLLGPYFLLAELVEEKVLGKVSLDALAFKVLQVEIRVDGGF